MLSRDKIERTVDVVWVELATTSKFIAPPLSPHLMQRYSIEVRLYIRADMPLAGENCCTHIMQTIACKLYTLILCIYMFSYTEISYHSFWAHNIAHHTHSITCGQLKSTVETSTLTPNI